MPMTRSAVTVRVPIRNLFIRRKVQGAIAELVSARVPVPESMGSFPLFDQSNRVLEIDDTITDLGGAPIVDSSFTSDTYDILDKGLKHAVKGSDWNAASPAYRDVLRQNAMDVVKDKLNLRHEVDLRDLLFSATTFSGKTSNLSGTSQWSNSASTPATDFETAHASIETLSSAQMNSLIINPQVLAGLRTNPQLLSLLGKYNLKYDVITKQVLEELIAAMFEMEKFTVYLARMTYKTAIGATAAYVWGKGALFGYIDPNATTMNDVTLVKTFVLDGGREYGTDFYKDEARDKDVWWALGAWHYGHKVVCTDAGYYFGTAVA